MGIPPPGVDPLSICGWPVSAERGSIPDKSEGADRSVGLIKWSVAFTEPTCVLMA